MAAIVGTIVIYFLYQYFNPIKNSNSTIGTSKIVDGIEYCNLGDLDDQDNWKYVGPAEFQYFINTYSMDNGEVRYSLSTIEDENANYVDYFYDHASAEGKLNQLIRENRMWI